MLSAPATPSELAAAFAALESLAPEASRRAAAATAHILDCCRHSPDGPHIGKLTGDGFPVELVFSSRDTAIRYTCEVAGAGIDPHKRLQGACDLLEDLLQPCEFPFASLQIGCRDLAWGAWLGGRHTATSDRFKIYAEGPTDLTPAARGELSEAFGRHHALLDSHVYRLRIVGFDPVAQVVEFYFRGRVLEPQELRGLLRLSGMAHQEDAFFSLLEEASQSPARVRLPGRQHGFSISLEPTGAIRAFSFFVFARSLFGADRNTRSALFTLSRRRGWNLDPYAAVSALLPREQEQGPRHGLISFIVERSKPPSISVGLRPAVQV